MQLHIQIKLEEPLELPINYHHILQAVIYENIRDGKGLNEFYHDGGVRYEKRNYKLFTFGLLQGQYQIRDRKIVFSKSIKWEIRSIDDYFLLQLERNILSKGISFGNRLCRAITVRLQNNTIETESVTVKMDSPICVYSTKEDGYTEYYEPWNDMFRSAVNDNFVRKFYAAYEEMPISGIRIEPLKVSERDKYITRYKSTYICGWNGYYQLTAEAEYLNFLYQTGIGSKNAQGFGMFQSVGV